MPASPFAQLITKWREILAALSATFGALCLGTALGWSSPSSDQLKHDTNIRPSAYDVFLIGSLMNVGALFGGLCGGILVNSFGRKMTMIGISAPNVLGWLLIGYAKNVAMVDVGRIITGFCGGVLSLAIPIYIGETASASVRGMLGSGFQLLVTVGILFTYVVGTYVNWNWLATICGVLPLIFMLIMFLMPESPTYNLAKNDENGAKINLLWLREKGYDVEGEMKTTKDALEESKANAASWSSLLLPHNLRPFLISMGLMLFQQLSGVNAVIFYTVDIFSAAGSTMSPNMQTIVVGVVQVLATVAATLLMDVTGRRVLLIISDLIMAISLFALGTFFYFKQAKNVAVLSSISWLPLTSMVLFILVFSLGYGPIPWMMMGELFPSHIRGLASSVASAFNWTLAFAVTFAFGPVVTAIGQAATFWIFGGICVVGVLFVIFFVPETKGKTLEEIQRHFGVSEREDRTRPEDNTETVLP